MLAQSSQFEVRLARSDADLRHAQRLRYEVFVEELGGSGEMVDHRERLEQDRFDPHCDHLLLTTPDTDADGGVIGVYRLLRSDQAKVVGQFYSEDEYDLSLLKSSGRRLLELGRSCLAAPYRGGSAVMHLWAAIADYVETHQIEVLFGVASFHGTNIDALKAPLSFLHHRHLAPPELRVRAQTEHFQSMDLIPEDQLDRRAAMLQTPALIKAYLRLGGFVGEGAFVDHAFNTTDVCLVLDTARMDARQTRISTGRRDG